MKANRRKDSDEEQRDSASENGFRNSLMSEIDKVDTFFAAREAEYWYSFFIKLYPRILEVCDRLIALIVVIKKAPSS